MHNYLKINFLCHKKLVLQNTFYFSIFSYVSSKSTKVQYIFLSIVRLMRIKRKGHVFYFNALKHLQIDP